MAIRDLQANLTEMGRIRLGQRVATKNGGTRPDKLDTFRFTSPVEHLIVGIAALYGGTPGAFTGDGVRGKQFQVVTDASIIPVYLPGQKVDPFYEQWARGVCTRRCDGERDLIHDQQCDCSPEKRSCKPTTRVNLLLADVPGLGVWRLETHGIYAASEMSQLAVLLQSVTIPLPGRLMLEARSRKFFNREEGKVESRDWFTPIIIIDSITSRQVQMGGDALSQALRMGLGGAEAAPQIEAGPQARAIEAAPAGPDPALIERGLAFIAQVQPDGVADARARVAKMGNPAALVEALAARVRDLADNAEQAPPSGAEEVRAPRETSAHPSHLSGPADEGEEDPSATEAAAAPQAPDPAELEARQAAMLALVGAAGKLRMKTADINALINERFGVVATGATAEQLRSLAAELKERKP